MTYLLCSYFLSLVVTGAAGFINAKTLWQKYVKPNRNRFERLWCHEAIKNANLSSRVKLLILPVHAPDLNPIELWWAAIKGKVARLFRPKRSLAEAQTQCVLDLSPVNFPLRSKIHPLCAAGWKRRERIAKR